MRRSPIRPAARWLDTNLGGSGLLRDELRHIFPDSWAFFLGEIALYCFIILVATGIFLALFFQASEAPVVYQGSYAPLDGAEMSAAYDSVVDLSLDVRAGLLMRQVHHWAALVFVGALIIHLHPHVRHRRRIAGRGASTGSSASALLLLVGFNGLFGYSLPDDLLSGTGLRISYSITESIPFVGPAMPRSCCSAASSPPAGSSRRVYPVHIFLLPAAIAGLLGAHLGLLWLQRHTQFPGLGRSDRTIVGTPMVPAYALRTTGYFCSSPACCTAFGAFVQINPVWLYGPYRAWDATTAAQPDWYMGWLEGGVRMMPGWDIQIGGLLIPAIFWPAVILPGLIFTPLFLLPWLDWVGDARRRLPQRAACCPASTRCVLALAAGFVTFLTVLLVAGGNDVFAFVFGWSQPTLLRVLQLLVIVLPPVVALRRPTCSCAAGPGGGRPRSAERASRRDGRPGQAERPETPGVRSGGSTSTSTTAAASTSARHGPVTLNSAQAAGRRRPAEQPQREHPEQHGRGEHRRPRRRRRTAGAERRGQHHGERPPRTRR